MNVPGGGECGETINNPENSFDNAGSSSATNSRTTRIGAKVETFGATTAAGSGALAVQQSLWTDWCELDAREQQLCASL
jgi:hypothetical protein